MDLELYKITDYDKTLLLHSINCYTDEIIFNDLKNDLTLLKDLQLRVCSIEL